jgi:hypothetical protein
MFPTTQKRHVSPFGSNSQGCIHLLKIIAGITSGRGIFIFGGGNKRLRNVTKMYCQCQISHKRRKKECLGKFKFSLNRLKKQILRKPIFVSASKGKVILI